MEVYLGLDLGTTSLKALLVDKNGVARKSLSCPLSLKTPKPAWAEQDPEDWVRAAENLLALIPKKFKVRRIGLSGQMHSLVALDARDKVIRPAILWSDQRCTEQCRSATEILGGEAKVIKMIGNPILEGFTLGKILWLREKEAANFKRMKSFLMPKDYLAFRLSGQKGIDYSDASGVAAFDVSQGRWNQELLRKLDLPESLFPEVQESFAARGRLKPELAQKFGLDQVEIAAGGADNAASALGAGALTPGDVVVSVGTSGTVVAITDKRKADGAGRLHFFSHAAPGLRYYMGVMLAAASAVNFFTAKMGGRINWDKLNQEAALVPPGSGGLIFLPYLNGERTPHRDSAARGVLCGLSQRSDWPHIIRAAMEGVSFGLRDSFELVKKLTQARRVQLVGGGAKNPLWQEILAANFQQPLTVPEVDEGGAYGAAMLAALGDGLDLGALSAWVKVKKHIKPQESLIKAYDSWYTEFQGLYVDLKKRFKTLATLANLE